jgi:tripeptidyl-peptidase I
MLSTGVVFAAILAVAVAKPAARDLSLHERRDAAPAGFVHAGPAAAQTQLNLRLGLANTDFPGLEKALYDVSTPSSPQYGEHLTPDEVLSIALACNTQSDKRPQIKKFMAPKEETVKVIESWLSEHGITAKTISPNGDWLGITVPVEKANELFDADFSVFKHTDTDKDTIRTLSYSIPKALKGHLDVVHPTVS